VSSACVKPPRYITGELFLRGPIPLGWLAAANHLGGKVLSLGVYVWHLAGLLNSMRVKLPTRRLLAFGFSRPTIYLALAALEREGLLGVERRPGQCPVVTLIMRCCDAAATATASDLS
jgi:hypothetical protein